MTTLAPGVTTSAGHAIVAQLEAEGVHRVYCVPGESYLDVLDGLRDSSVETIVCRHEGGAAFMAIAEARITGTVGVAAVTRGPGAANAAIGIHTAYQDATPVILLVGLIPVGDRNRESFQEFDLSGWFGTTAKAVWTLDEPGRAAEMVRDAIHLARSGRPGPVVLGLPEDVLVGPCDAATLSPRVLPAGGVDAARLAQLGAWLQESSRPLVLLGGEVLSPAGARDLREWVQEWRLPVVTDFRTQDQLDHDSPSWCGWLGYGRCDSTAALLDDADLLLVVGDALRDVLSDGYRLGADARRRTVLIGLDPDALGHHGGVDLHLLIAPHGWVAAARELPPPAEPRWAGRTARAHEAVTAWATPEADHPAWGVDLAVAMRHVRDRLAPDAIVTYGAGKQAVWAQRFLPAHAYPSVLGPRNGAMGFGVPAAVAASLAQPGRQVLSVAGDGCFLMNAQELATAIAYGAWLTVLVVDNAQYGTIRVHQERDYPGRVSGTQLVNPDFAAYARAFGAFGQKVGTTREVPAALDAAFAHEGPAVIHLVVDPEVVAPR